MPASTESLCDFVRRCYPLPGLEPVLLRLQDAHGLDVLLLLTACWLGELRQPLARTDWVALNRTQDDWHQQVIQPLRQARRGLKALADEPALYAELKAAEQALEWRCLERLASECRIDLGDCCANANYLEQLSACCRAADMPLNTRLESELRELSEWMKKNARSEGGRLS